MRSFFYSLNKTLKKNKKNFKYKEIFSNTDRNSKHKNTIPLKVFNNSSKSFLSDEFYNKTKISEYLSNEFLDLYGEYTQSQSFQSAKNINQKLKKEIKALKTKLFILTIFLIFSLILDTLIKINFNLILHNFIDTQKIYLITSFLIFILSCIVGFKTIKSAFKHVFALVFTLDTAIIFPFISTLFNFTFSIFFSFIDKTFHPSIFNSPFIFNFILIIYSSLIDKKRILKNFKFVISSKQKYNVDIYNINNLVFSNNHKKKLFAAYQHKTDFLANFIKNSFKETQTEYILSKIIPFGMIFSLICGILTFILNKNISSSIIAFNISSFLSVPFGLLFLTKLIAFSLCKYVLKKCAMIIGENVIKKMSYTKNLVLNDSDLYPQKNVVLRGIKTFNGQRIDEAIISAASIICQTNAPISQVFDKIIFGKKKLLSNPSDISFKEEKGIMGWVNGKRVLVGNRELLKDFKIAVPSRDYEKKYKIPNCEHTYFAIGNELVAMFILEYIPSKSMYKALLSCAENNIKIFVKTVDSNLTLKKISYDFNLDKKLLKLIPFNKTSKVNDLYSKTEKFSEAFFATLGSCASFVKSICACCLAQNNIILITAIQILHIFFNIFLVLYLIFCSSLSELHSIELTIYLFLWIIFSWLASKIKKLKY